MNATITKHSTKIKRDKEQILTQHLKPPKNKELQSSRKHAYIILIPLNPAFILLNWGLQGYTLFFLFLLINIDCGYSLEPPRRGIDCGYSLEPPRRGGSNECLQSMFLLKNIDCGYVRTTSSRLF